MKASAPTETARGKASFLVPLALLAYPLLSHSGALSGNHIPTVLTLAGVLLCVALLALARRRWQTVLTVLPLSAALVGFVLLEQSAGIVYAMPVMICLSLSALFGLTLLPGRLALISRLALHVHGGLDPRTARYTRLVTQVWTGFFLALALESLLLGLYAPPATWSLFTNLLNYLFVALLFLIEYRVRLHALRGLEHPGFIQFLRILARTRLWSLPERQ